MQGKNISSTGPALAYVVPFTTLQIFPASQSLPNPPPASLQHLFGGGQLWLQRMSGLTSSH